MSHVTPAAYATAPWKRVSERELKPAQSVPTMLHRQEQKLYYWLTRNAVGGNGAVVDLGSFVGGSSARLAQGLVDAGSDRVVHAYDRFTADLETKRFCLYSQGIVPFEGSDVLPLARELLAPWKDHIRLHVGEIQEIGWDPANGPISVLLLDACKRTEWTDYTARTFYPHLIAGQSVINHQDFLQWNQFWLPPHMLLMADYFEPLAYIRETSVLFRCTRRPDEAEIEALTVARMDDQQMVEAIRDMKRRFRGWGMGGGFDMMIETIRINPGERRHWKMAKPIRTAAGG